MVDVLRNQVLELDEADRIALLIEIWDSLTSAEPPALTDGERRLIEQRLQEHRDAPHDTVSLEEAERILSRKSP